MKCIQVQGGIELLGEVEIQGSKNAALPILAASILTSDCNCIFNCPKISDVYNMLCLLKSLGAKAKWEKNGLVIDCKSICHNTLPSKPAKEMRSSIYLLGACLGRCGEVILDYPGGCVIGERPIDLHLSALEKMGVEFSYREGLLYARTGRLTGADIFLRFPSVGATENIILAAVLASGITKITGAAREPEICELCQYLRRCGAKISGDGSSVICISGVEKLHGCDYELPGDRIVAGTYLFAALTAGGEIYLKNVPCKQLEAVLNTINAFGGKIETEEKAIYVQSFKRPNAIREISTGVYPGFPTDLQSMAVVAASLANGNTWIVENIFEDRFLILDELKKMGGEYERINNKRILVKGVRRLHAAKLTARDLRGGAALVIAALNAQDTCIINNCDYIFRGYENICEDLRKLGARVTGV